MTAPDDPEPAFSAAIRHALTRQLLEREARSANRPEGTSDQRSDPDEEHP